MIVFHELKKKSGVENETIYREPEFLKWKEQLNFELNKMKDDEYIVDILKVLNGFRGFGDRELFEKLESKLYVLREHLDEY